MSINKVVYGGKTLIDLTGDTVTADKLLSGITAHGKDGELVTGTCTFDVDSNDATVAVAAKPPTQEVQSLSARCRIMEL